MNEQMIQNKYCKDYFKLNNLRQDVQTGRMDTTVTIPVALIASCLGCVIGKQDIVTVKWVGNQKNVTHVRICC